MSIQKLGIPTRRYGQPIPVAPDMNEVVEVVNELVDAVSAGLATSNAIVGGMKLVRYRSSLLYGVPAGALTLDRIDAKTIVPGTLAYVHNPADAPLQVVAAPLTYLATIVAAGTAGAVQVPRYIGAPAADTVLITWQPWVMGGGVPSLSLAVSLGQVQALLPNATSGRTGTVNPGLLYLATGDWDALGTDSTIFVKGLNSSAFELRGILLRDSVFSEVFVNVADGTTAPIIAASSFADLQGDPDDNPALAFELSQLATKQGVSTALAYKQQQLNDHETRIGTLEDNAPADLSGGNVLYVQGAGQQLPGRRNDPNRPFRTIAEAADWAYSNDVIFVRPGGTSYDAFGRRCYSEYVPVYNNATIVCEPGAVFTGTIDIGNFAGSQPHTVNWYGGIVLNSMNLIRQKGGASTIRVLGTRLEGLGYIQAFGNGSAGDYTDSIELRGIVARLGAGAAGAILVTGRSDINQSQRLELTGCDLQTADCPALVFSGSYDPASGILSQVVVRGSTQFRRTDGGAAIVINPTQPGGASVPQGDVIIDERPQGGGGAGYTDAQAVQAVNNAQVASKSIAVSSNNLEVKAKGITAGMLSQEVQDLISGGGVMTPLTNDTLFCHMADTADPLGFLKNLADGPDLRYGPGPASPLRVTPNALNGFPAVSFANNDSTQPDPSTYNTKYYGTAPAPGPATVTFLLRCNKAFDSSTDGKEISAGLLLNYPYATAASTGPALKLDNNFAIVTVIYTGLGRGQFFLNGRYLDTIAGSGFDLWPTGNDGGTFRLGLTFTGDLVAYIVSRDASRAAGRLHESYLNQKYNVY